MNADRIASSMAELIENYSWGGACYASTAIMHSTLKLAGIETTPCLGVVKCSNGDMFDHAWLEVNGTIYDVALPQPLPQSESTVAQFVPRTGFRGVVETPNFTYGIDMDLDQEATLLSKNFHNIMDSSPSFEERVDYWNLTEVFAKYHGLDVDKENLIEVLLGSAWVVKRA